MDLAAKKRNPYLNGGGAKDALDLQPRREKKNEKLAKKPGGGGGGESDADARPLATQQDLERRIFFSGREEGPDQRGPSWSTPGPPAPQQDLERRIFSGREGGPDQRGPSWSMAFFGDFLLFFKAEQQKPSSNNYLHPGPQKKADFWGGGGGDWGLGVGGCSHEKSPKGGGGRLAEESPEILRFGGLTKKKKPKNQKQEQEQELFE